MTIHQKLEYIHTQLLEMIDDLQKSNKPWLVPGKEEILKSPLLVIVLELTLESTPPPLI